MKAEWAPIPIILGHILWVQLKSANSSYPDASERAA